MIIQSFVVCADLRFSFKNETTYGEAVETLNAFTEELRRNFEKCRTSIIIDE